MSAKKMGMLVGTLLLARDLAHREHWKTKSYAVHKTTDDFYSAVVGLADGLVEQYQGAFDTRLDVPLATHDGEMPFRDLLRAQLDYIREVRYDAAPRDQTAIQNKIDEIEGVYQSTIFLLSLS